MYNLGIVSKIIDTSHSYARGSFEIHVSYEMDGMRFEAVRFVRTDIGLDVVHFYTANDSHWCSDYMGAIAFKGPEDMRSPNVNASRYTKRALALLDLACNDVPGCTAERFAQIELD